MVVAVNTDQIHTKDTDVKQRIKRSDSRIRSSCSAVCKSRAAKFIWIIDKIVDNILILGVMLAIALMAYSCWDNNYIEQEAAPETYAVYKPSGEVTLSFSELKKKNPDVFGWIDIYGTTIDYPVVQGSSNQEYLSMDAEGKFSLTGALFLDKSNRNDFKDFDSIIYGHNMVPEVMFGGIKRFKNKTFFASHKYGDIYYNGKHHGLRIFALVETDGYDWAIYNPGVTGNAARSDYLQNLLKKKIRYRKVSLDMNNHIVLLSTCTEDKTNGRLILAAKITDRTFDDTFAEKHEDKTYDITTAVTGGRIDASVTGIAKGSRKTITYNPSKGYKLKSITVDGKAVDISKYPSSYTFSDIAANHNIKVVYEKKINPNTPASPGSSKNTGNGPNTGDTSNILIWLLTCGIGMTIAGLLEAKRRKSQATK